MSQRPKSSQSVALFPFLAVLVCTMGSLIFLLLVTTRMMRNVAIAQAAAEKAPRPVLPLMDVAEPEPAASLPEPEPDPVVIPAAPQIPESDESAEPKVDMRAMELARRERELEELAHLWKQRVGKLADQKADRAKLLEQRKLLRQTSTQRISALTDEAKELETNLGAMTGELSAKAMDTSSKEQADLEKKIAELKLRLLAAQQAQESDGAFQVVPFDVNTGTSRRPILIECMDSGLRFIPEDVKISAKDLEGFTPQVNPLIAGASSLVNYWTAWNMKQANPAREPEPYVLLMVRPSGTVAYYVAMKMLSNLKQPHGYELIEEDTVLQVPPVDVGAKAACEAAVKRLINERNQVMRAAGSGGIGVGRGASPDAFRSDATRSAGTGRGAKVAGGSSNGGRGQGDGKPGSGSAGGAGSGAEGSESSSGDKFELTDIITDEDRGGDNWERVEKFEGRPPRGGTAAAGRGGSGGGIASSNIGGGMAGVPRGSIGKSQEPSGGGNDRQVAVNGSNGPRGSMVQKQPGGTMTAGSASAGSAQEMSDAGGATAEDPAIGSTDDAIAADNPQAGIPGGKSRNPKAGVASKAGNLSGTEGSEVPTGIESLEESLASKKESGDTAGGSERPDLGRGGVNRSIPVQDTRKKKQKSSDKAMPFDPQQLVGRHWGISEPGANIGLEREMQVTVEPERFVIAGKHAVTVHETDSRENVFDRMVTVLDLQAKDWGKPPQGFFWKPSLRFIVTKGGDANYEKIHTLLEEAGLSGTREFASNHPDHLTKPGIAEKGPDPTPKPQPVTAPAKPQRRFLWGFPR